MVECRVSKFSAFVNDKRVRNVVCQGDDTFDIDRLMKEGKTIIFDFGKYYYDKDANKILSSLLFHVISKKLRTRENKINTSVSLYIDEVQKWDTQSLVEIIMYSAKNNISVTSMSSRLKQIDKPLRYELFRSGTIVSFRQIGKDAEKLSKDIFSGKAETITNLKKYQALMRTLKNGDTTESSVIDTTGELLQNNNQDTQVFKNISQKKYGFSVEKVENEINRKMSLG